MDINSIQNYYHVPKSNEHCYIVNITAEHSISQADNPLSQALPLLATQIAIVMLVTHTLFYLLRPFYIPRIVAYILGGVLMGPTALFNIRFFASTFPLRSVLYVETVAYWALSCHMFLVGLEMDMTALLRTGKKAINIALAGVLIPFIVGVGLFFLMHHQTHVYKTAGCLFFAGALAVTGFPVVARVLTDVRLLHAEIGRMAVSISVINDLISWLILAVLISIRVSLENAVFAVVSTIGFAVFCVLLVRPAIAFIINRTSNGENFNEYYLCCVLVAVSVFACFSEMLGTNSMVGAFIFGLIMPNRILASVLLEKFEDFVSGYLLPLFFAVCGIRINIWSIHDWGVAIIVIILAGAAKIFGTMIAVLIYKIRPRDCFALGLLMNTKGIIAMIILNFGYDKEFLNGQDYAVMVVAIVIMTGAVAPTIATMYRPAKRLFHYKRRTIQKARADSEFRILTCFYDIRTVLGMIHLLDCSNATKESPLNVFGLHLVELTGRASAMLIVHNPGKKSSSRDPKSEKIITALETYANLNEHVSIHLMTAFSPFPTMHEDICCLSEDKHIGFLILPFHKLPSHDGQLEDDGKTTKRGVNLNVLPNAPCTVGIFVDRGFGAATQEESNLRMRQVAMLFVGGPDDREALAFAWRMAGTHGVSLTVVRFIAGEGAEEIEPIDLPGGGNDAQRLLTSMSYVDRQRTLDDDYVNQFRLKTAGEEFISYEEKVVNNDEETVEVLKEMNHINDLYIVGKGEGIVTPITAGLLDWCEFPELGPMGDLLVTSAFARGSVLVVQQYAGPGGDVDDDDTPDGSVQGMQQFGTWRPSVSGRDQEEGEKEVGFEAEPFGKQ